MFWDKVVELVSSGWFWAGFFFGWIILSKIESKVKEWKDRNYYF